MSLQTTQLSIATNMTRKALLQDKGDPSVPTFRAAYGAVTKLNAGANETWSEATLNAAWAMTDRAYPNGTSVDTLAVHLSDTHAAVIEIARPARPR